MMELIKGLFKRGSTSRETGLNKELTDVYDVYVERELATVQELAKKGIIMMLVCQTCLVVQYHRHSQIRLLDSSEQLIC
jgi:hypothetical protein